MTEYQPDWTYCDGQFRKDYVLTVSDDGQIVSAKPVSGASSGIRLADRALLPGLVNAHSHAFQRLIRARTESASPNATRSDFWTWREAMYQIASALGPDELYVASRQAFLEMALAGITAVGEFHYLHHDPHGRPYGDVNELAKRVIRAARDVGLRITLLRVGYERSGYRLPEEPRQRRFKDRDVGDFLRAAEDLRAAIRFDSLVNVGLAPHSVRAVSREWLEAVAGQRSHPIHMHVAEQPDEVSACLREHHRRPVELLSEVGLLNSHFTAVHGIDVEHTEIAALGRAQAMVCACPSTEQNLGDGVVLADELSGAGVRMCLGSDSQARIDLLEEARQLEGNLRLLRRRRAILDPTHLFQMATRHGANSLAIRTGELSPGMWADFFTVDLNHPSVLGSSEQDLLSAVIFGAEKGAIRDVAVAGRFIVRDGAHPLGEEIARDYRALAGKTADLF